MAKNVRYYNKQAVEIKAKVKALLNEEKGTLTLKQVLEKLGLEEGNRSIEILVGNALRKCGFVKIRNHPDKKYFYIHQDELEGEESCQASTD